MADRMGTPYLQKVLNQQLSNHIRETLPSEFLKDLIYSLRIDDQVFICFQVYATASKSSFYH